MYGAPPWLVFGRNHHLTEQRLLRALRRSTWGQVIKLGLSARTRARERPGRRPLAARRMDKHGHSNKEEPRDSEGLCPDRGAPESRVPQTSGGASVADPPAEQRRPPAGRSFASRPIPVLSVDCRCDGAVVRVDGERQPAHVDAWLRRVQHQKAQRGGGERGHHQDGQVARAAGHHAHPGWQQMVPAAADGTE